MKTFVYAGSFDPLTKGHQWVIDRAPRPLVILVANNPGKKYMFSLAQRTNMVRSWIWNLRSTEVFSLQPDEYLVDAARRHDAAFIVRGARNAADFEYERAYSEVNRSISGDVCHEIPHLLMLPPPELAAISSSVVKSLVGPKGWEDVVAKYVNPEILEMLRGQTT